MINEITSRKDYEKEFQWWKKMTRIEYEFISRIIWFNYKKNISMKFNIEEKIQKFSEWNFYTQEKKDEMM